ncbi:hypothetical protein [Neorhodopirellula pilleata]|uniref:Uncharacterized protein n=1 Tax=Neorhodopirellula pilleata TaxID=2714738 RepID=A0A5C6AB54_9BACT|nr:hypothetical protein [Neorhodopirellula pilleata]TWT95563.1 hypothetical protein Pla100_32040 [Neorhodopirellula pilleata]
MYRVKPAASGRKHRATRKRIWLAKILCVGATGLSVGATEDRSFATEPSPTISSRTEVRNNPFVLPSATSTNVDAGVRSAGGSILRTSDLQHSEMRLKSIGTAVGLVPIGRPRPAQTILEVSQPSESRIQVNPLANDSVDLIDQPVIGLVESTIETDLVSPSPIIAPPEKAEPIEFSMSDWDEPSLATMEVAIPEPIAAPEKAEELLEEEASVEVAPAGNESVEDELVGNEMIELVIPEPSNDPLQSLPLLPAPNPEWVASNSEPKTESKPAVVNQAVLNPFARYPDRRRAHVQVDPPPMISFEPEDDALASSKDAANPVTVVAAPIVPAQLATFEPASSGSEAIDSTPKPLKQQSERTVKSAAPVDPLVAEIHEIYPSSQITMTKIKGRLLVHGMCADREEATEIIRLIRSKHLIPVDDKMQIR